MAGQIVDTYSDAQVWATNDPDRYSQTTQNLAGPNTAGKGNVGGQTHRFLDSQGTEMGTIDDRGLLFNRGAVGMTGEIKIFPFKFAVDPPGLLYCDGSAISRTIYANLFAVLGTTFGVGNGSTTFNLPKYQDITLGAIGPTTFTAPQTVVGSNAAVNLQHFHSGAVHTHDLSGHTHTLNGHTHTMSNHTHTVSHNHNIATATGQTSGDGAYSTGPQKTGSNTPFDLNDTNHTHGLNHAHGGTTGGSNTANSSVPSVNISGTPSLDVSSSPSSNITGNPSAANTGNALSATQSIIQATMGFYVYIKT